jgi:hypothetical protein
MIRNTDPNSILKPARADEVHYPYTCTLCHNEFWFSRIDIMHLTDQPVMPCSHAWEQLAYDWSRDPSASAQAQAAQESPRPAS